MKKVTITNRSVYHKIASVEIYVPNTISDENIDDYIHENEHLWVDRLDDELNRQDYYFGLGLGDGFDEGLSESETRYDTKKYGGHL
jgi:hypothetical protein